MEPRNYLANAGGTPPEAPASPSNGYPQSAVPGVSEATVPGPHWFFKVGEELRAIITAAGLTPSDANIAQLLAALQGGFGLAKSLSNDGYITLPGGLIIQWGGLAASGGAVSVSGTLPLTFPNARYATLALCVDQTGGTVSTVLYATAATNTLSQIGLSIKDAGAYTSLSLRYLTIGR